MLQQSCTFNHRKNGLYHSISLLQ
uniref:Uncharacterized protein n=1 Tax=Rhizophora mucronata TaxID=61149 RepID=A0A2P2Q9F6_RHIMU